MTAIAAPSTTGSPTRPVALIAQLQALFSDPCNRRAIAAGDALVERYVRDGVHLGTSANTQRATALMQGLAPDCFDDSFWQSPHSLRQRVALGAFARVFDTLQRKLTSLPPPSAQRVPLRSAATAQNRSLPTPVSVNNLVLTLFGTVYDRREVHPDLVVLDCARAGPYSKAHWTAAEEHLSAIAPLYKDTPHLRSIVVHIMNAPTRSRGTLATLAVRVANAQPSRPTSRACEEVLRNVSTMPGQEEHIARCVLRLVPSGSAVSPKAYADFALAMLATNGIAEREVVVQHLRSLGFDKTLSVQDFRASMCALLALSGKTRAATVRAAKRLLTRAVEPSQYCAILLLLVGIAPPELDDFVFACQWGKSIRTRNPRPSYADIVDMHAHFSAGYRPSPNIVHDAHNVHRGTFTSRAISSINTLRALYSRLPPMDSFQSQVTVYIANLEKRTPLQDPRRVRQPGKIRTAFDDARHALSGGPDAYCSFVDNSETFAVGDGLGIRIGDLANLIWHAIHKYPHAALAAPGSATEVARHKRQMRDNFVAKLSDCVESNQRVCYAGKAMRILESVQGFIAGVGIDAFSGSGSDNGDEDGDEHGASPDEALAPGTLLAMRGAAFSRSIAVPSGADIEEFIGASLAAAEYQWADLALPKRDEFIRDLRDYVSLEHEDWNGDNPDFWRQEIFRG